MIARLVLAVMLLCSAAGLSPAAAQGAVQWWGTGVQGHLPMQANGGPAPLLMDAGGSPGAGLQPSNNANAGTLPTGVGFVNTGQGVCQWTGYSSAAYSELCSGFDGNGNALFTVDRIGGGTPPDCNFKINGTLKPCGGAGGTISEIDITANNGIILTPDPITSTGTIACTPASATLFGCVPASGGGTTNFLRADFTWGAPPGVGTVTSVGLSVPASSLFGVTGSPVTGSGTLGVTTTGTSGGIPYFSSGTQLNSSGALGAHSAVIGGGAGAAPTAIAGCTGGVLAWSTSSADPTCTATPTLGASGTIGSVSLGNATSGLVTLQTVTGALGTVAASFPANTGTVAELNLAQTWTAAQTFGQVFSTSRQSSATTESLAATDCGTEVIYTAATTVTVTIPQSIVPAANTNCYIGINQSGAGKVLVNGSAVTPATLVSASGFTGTSGTAGSEIALRLTTIGATTTATLFGDGS